MNQVEWKDEGISITFPINEDHIKGAIGFLLYNEKPVTIEAINAVMPGLLYNLGNEFYNNADQKDIEAEAEKVYQKLFPGNNYEPKPNIFMVWGIPNNWLGFMILLTVPFILITGQTVAFFPVLAVGWIYGYIQARKNPYFFYDFLKAKAPWLAKKMLAVALAVLIPLAVAHKTHAGMVVTDPTSYSYYVEQIKEATKQLETLQEQLETAQNSYQETMKMKSLLEGTYNHSLGTIEDLKKIQKAIKEDPTELLKYAEKFLADQAQGEEWINPEDIIGDIFVDPRKTQDQMERLKQLNEKFHMRQKTFEQAVVKAEKVHKEMPDKYARIEEIAAKIDTAQSTKEALDINNQLLAEILRAITDLVSLTGYIGEAQVMAHYKGVNDEELKEAEQQLKETQAASKGYQPQKEFLDKHGVDLNDSAEDAIMKMLGD